MRTFNDSKGRPWDLAINAFTLQRVKDSPVKLYLPGLFGEGEHGVSGYVAFLGDDLLRARTLFYLLAPSIDEADFMAGLDGDALEAGTIALQEELIDFFQKSRRDPVRKLLAKMQTLGEMLATQAVGRVEAMGQPEIDEVLRSLDAKLSASSGSSPASSASTPPALSVVLHGDSST